MESNILQQVSTILIPHIDYGIHRLQSVTNHAHFLKFSNDPTNLKQFGIIVRIIVVIVALMIVVISAIAIPRHMHQIRTNYCANTFPLATFKGGVDTFERTSLVHSVDWFVNISGVVQGSTQTIESVIVFMLCDFSWFAIHPIIICATIVAMFKSVGTRVLFVVNIPIVAQLIILPNLWVVTMAVVLVVYVAYLQIFIDVFKTIYTTLLIIGASTLIVIYNGLAHIFPNSHPIHTPSSPFMHNKTK